MLLSHGLMAILRASGVVTAGTVVEGNLVPEKSVEAGKYIFQGKVKSFTQITVTGDEAGHSDLPENRQIVDLIQKYMLDGIRRQPGASR